MAVPLRIIDGGGRKHETEMAWNAGGAGLGTVHTGDTQSYIRVKLVFTWKDKDGNVSAQPVTDQDYKMDLNKVDWFEKDGYYYAKAPVTPKDNTPVLIEKCTEVAANAPDGYTLSLEILADAIQSTPTRAVEQAWGVTVDTDGLLKEVQG